MRLLWLDLETTGLNPHDGSILEVAAVLTDETLGEGPCYQALIEHEVMPQMTNVAYAMHTRSGLLSAIVDACRTREAVPIQEIEHEIWRDIQEGQPDVILAGSNPGFDRRWLAVHMPKLHARLHYRMLDVNALYLLTGTPKRDRRHRAMDDIWADLDAARKAQQILTIGGFNEH